MFVCFDLGVDASHHAFQFLRTIRQFVDDEVVVINVEVFVFGGVSKVVLEVFFSFVLFLLALPPLASIHVAILVLIRGIFDELLLIHVELLEDVALRLGTQAVLFGVLFLHPPK